MTDLYHFYHVYADGEWQPALDEHFTALKEHGLADALKGFYLGVVGSDENVQNVIDYAHTLGVPFHVRADAPLGWEQVTLEALKRHMTVNDGYVLYAHTKGAHDPAEINLAWRSSMCYWNVVKWADAVPYLADHDAVGCHWVNDAMFGGNYWWATGRYIRTLKPLSYGDRWQAELWIGQKAGVEPIKVHDLRPGWPGMGRFTTSW